MSSTSTPQQSGQGASASGTKEADQWTDAIPKEVSYEDAMSQAECNRAWEKMYSAAGMSTANEAERRALKAAVYVYGAKNGTSREGEYAGSMTLSTGKSVDAAIIPRATGKFKIRKFFRANMNESYKFFKITRFMESDQKFVAKAAQYGISAENAFAMADWLTNCPMFTPGEDKAHNTVFTKSIERSRRARGGNSLEDVEEDRLDSAISANGPNHAQSHSTDW